MAILNPGIVVANVQLTDGRTVPVYAGQALPAQVASGELERLAQLGAIPQVEKPKRVKG